MIRLSRSHPRVCCSSRSTLGIDAKALAPRELTRREAEVLVLVSEGKTNPTVATLLGISPRTVQAHLERIYEKLGVQTRTGAVAAALRVVGAGPRSNRPELGLSHRPPAEAQRSLSFPPPPPGPRSPPAL